MGSDTFRKREVHPALRKYFSSAWFYITPPNAVGPSTLIPDGCSNLVWCHGALHFAGPDRCVKLEPVPPGTCVIGLKFRPGSAHHWIETPISDVVGGRLHLESFWGSEARGLSDWIGETEDPDGLAQRIEHGLTRRLHALAPMDALPQAIFRTVRNRRFYSTPITQQLVAQFGLSERSLRRRCHEAFGYGPKTLDRILRFQRFMQLARRFGIGATAELASAAGYSDQAHLVREARILSGMTPSAILEHIVL